MSLREPSMKLCFMPCPQEAVDNNQCDCDKRGLNQSLLKQQDDYFDYFDYSPIQDNSPSDSNTSDDSGSSDCD